MVSHVCTGVTLIMEAHELCRNGWTFFKSSIQPVQPTSESSCGMVETAQAQKQVGIKTPRMQLVLVKTVSSVRGLSLSNMLIPP